MKPKLLILITMAAAVLPLCSWSSAVAANVEHTISHDAYVVRWQQDVMPITDLSVLNLLVTRQQLRELARTVIDNDTDLEDVDFTVACHSNSKPAITPYGATVQVVCLAESVPDQDFELSSQHRAQLRDLFLAAWEESFKSVYQEASKSRIADWHLRVEAIKHQRRQAQSEAEHLRDRLAKLEQERIAHESRAKTVAQLDDRIARYQMDKDELTAHREALETQLKKMKEQADEAAGGGGVSPKIIEHFRRALELETKRLAVIKHAYDKGKDTVDRVFEAENRVIEAQIALERAQREAAGSDRMEALLHDLNQVNVQLMQVIFTIRESERRHQEAIKPAEPDSGHRRGDAALLLDDAVRVEYEVAERRLLKLTERLAEVEDSGENIVSPLTFIRLSK